jgi:DNA-binding NarL/FixJ family response regulator
MAQGLSNHQIAERLVLSHTVNKHTQSIYGKLRVNSRTAATRYALEHSLL